MTDSDRRRQARAGVTQIHHSPQPVYRVLLLDSRWDGLPVAAEDAIASSVGRDGLQIDLDAISDPRSTLRVLDKHPNALDGYDAVVAVPSPRADWRRSSKVLTRIVDRLRTRMPTLLVEHRPGSGPQADPSAPDGSRVDTLLLPAEVEPMSAARQIGAALHALLDELEAQLAAATAVAAPPTAASRLRDDIGTVAIDRLERIAGLAKDTFGLPVAEVNLLHAGSVTTVASSGALPRSHPASDSLCAIALERSGITVMADTWLDGDAYTRTPTHGDAAIRFYAACPIRSAAGRLMGTLCIWDTAPHASAEFDFAFLQDLALLAEGELVGSGGPAA